MPAPTRRTPFVGRTQELAALAGQLATAGLGQGGLVLVGGEPGVGKTRLLDALRRYAEAGGWHVLSGQAYDSTGMPPYLPFVEALRTSLRACAPAELAERLGSAAPELVLLMPELQQLLPDLPSSPPVSAEHARYRLFESIAEVLARTARASPAGALLLLDDLHWADQATLLLLLHLARGCATMPLLIVGAYRTTDLSRTHPLAAVLADVRRERLAERLALGPLLPADATALIAAIAALAPTPEFASVMYEQTDGNAFFLEEVVRQVLAEGRDISELRHEIERWDLPEGVREVVGRRLSRLSPAANAVLQAAAVLDEGGTVELLMAMTVQLWAPLVAAVEESVAAGVLLETAGSYGFTHALIQRTVLDELSLPRRQRLHLAAAEALEQVYAQNLAPLTASLAHHYRMAGSSAPAGKACGYARRAATAAHAVMAWEEEVFQLQAALELTPPQDKDDPDEADDLLLALGAAQQRAGDRDGARETFARAVVLARQARDHERLARAALGFAGSDEEAQPDAATIGLLEEALAALKAGDSHLRAMLLSRVAIAEVTSRGPEWEQRYRDNGRLAEEAVAVARRSGDTEALLRSLLAQLHTHWLPEYLHQRQSITTELIQLATQTNHPEWELDGRLWRLIALLEHGERERFDAELAVFAQKAAALRQPFFLVRLEVIQATCALLDGRLDESERLAGEALRLSRPLRSTWATWEHQNQLFGVRLEQGRLQEIERSILVTLPAEAGTSIISAILATLPVETGSSIISTMVLARLALLYSELERPNEVRKALDELAARGFFSLAHASSSFAMAAQACAAIGNQEYAARIYVMLEPFAAENIVMVFLSRCLGPVPYYLGLLATTMKRWETAEQHFTIALDMATRLRAIPYRAHTLRAFGAMLLRQPRRGVRARARVLLEEALALYNSVGMTHFATKTEALIAGAGSATALSAAVYPDGLSAREGEVLRLVAAGKSNPEIAEALVISIYTVYRHVNHILAKTGCSNRVEATSYAHRHKLVE